MNDPTGIFTISLDFELHWGGFEKWHQDHYRQYFLNTRRVIPSMLQLFGDHGIHVTWATVGLLLHESRQALIGNIPSIKPSYLNNELSAYEFMRRYPLGGSESDDPLHYAPTLARQIVATPGQELGSHTFAHYYCNEPGQTLDQFREDLRAAQRSAMLLLNRRLRSLVFPRNQFNDEYLKVCFEEGFTAVRDNPRDWFWKIRSTENESAWKRLNRGLDAYVPVGKKNTYSVTSVAMREGLPLCLPASRLLRPYRPAELILNRMKIARIKSEMERAARQREVYHLWWHPHNFGNFPDQSLSALSEILSAYDSCRRKYNMQSLNMGETTDLITMIHGKAKVA